MHCKIILMIPAFNRCSRNLLMNDARISCRRLARKNATTRHPHTTVSPTTGTSRLASSRITPHLTQPGIPSVASRQREGVGKAGRNEARKSAGCVSHETLRFTGEGGYLGLRSYDRARALALVRCARVDIVNISRCLHTTTPTTIRPAGLGTHAQAGNAQSIPAQITNTSGHRGTLLG